MDEGLKNLIVKAEQGDIEAMVMVGDCYNRGFHTEKDASMSHLYYKMAADKGHSRAAFLVAIDYLNGIGTSKNKAAGTKYLKNASDAGVADAQYMLGSLYHAGQIGMLFREQKAAEYYEKAAKQGHAGAQLELGDLNIMNEGYQYSLEKGLFWLSCAYLHVDAAEESNKAMKRLNSLLQSGLPGGKKRVDEIIANIKKNYASYIHNPK